MSFRITESGYGGSIPHKFALQLRYGSSRHSILPSRAIPLHVMCHAATWQSELSPYETLGLERDAKEEDIKSAYRKMAKKFHPDVARNEGLEEGETAESRFVRIQAAYELLMDEERRREYDRENRVNPMQASKAWAEWVMKKRRAFDQRGDMAASAWAESQQRELNLRARSRSRAKIDPEEERRNLARERQASMDTFETTLKRHTIVLKKRDIVRKRAEEQARKLLVADLLAAEGFELEEE